MRFINPKIDFAFKKIFGNEQHKNILISFLNAILYDNQPHIETLEIIDPYNAPKLSGLKDTFLDVRAKLSDGSQVIIEMQVLAVAGFGKRVLYNISKAYSGQLKRADDYSTLNPVIGLTITDFDMFERDTAPDVVSRYGFYDQEHNVAYPNDDITLVFVELTKFSKTLDELSTLTDKWLYFLRYASQLEDVPTELSDDAVLVEAFDVANRINLSQAELDALENKEFFVGSMSRTLKMATQQAEKRGMERGREDGLQEGRQEGIKTVARQLLDVLDDDTISQKTGLTVDEVRQLRN